MALPANATAIMDGLIADGLTPVAAAGILGNVEAESGGDLNSVGSGGGGLIGYTPISSAPAGGAPGQPIGAQISAIVAYIQRSYPGGVQQLDAFTDPEAAGESFAQYGERCAACGYQDGTSQLAIRGANAQEAYQAYQSGTLGSAQQGSIDTMAGAGAAQTTASETGTALLQTPIGNVTLPSGLISRAAIGLFGIVLLYMALKSMFSNDTMPDIIGGTAQQAGQTVKGGAKKGAGAAKDAAVAAAA